MPDGVRAHLDDWAGQGIEAVVRHRHRRRLTKLGALAQLDPPDDGRLYAAADPPPRRGNALDVLIDGATAMPAVAEALAGARSHVHIAGWHITPGFGLTREHDARRVRDVLGELAETVDVRVLLWAGAPAKAMKPTRAMVRDVRDELMRGTKVQVVLDSNERPMHCHHEKLVVVDDDVAFVNGIDMTTLQGDRFDSSDHPARGHLGWHDVGTRLRGPIVGDVAAHFAARWDATAGTRATVGPPPGPAGDVEVQLVRTVPNGLYDFRRDGEFRILEAYTRALRSARELIYLEDQFLWSPEIVEILAHKLDDPPSDDFRTVILLPSHPTSGGDDTRGQLSELVEADDGNARFLATTLSARSGGLTDPLYVHAKVGIVDDRWLTVGSANLNEHSLFNDTEVNVVTCDAALARETRLRLWAEHLERDVSEVDGPTAKVVDELWRPIAAEGLERLRAGAPATHRLQELPGVSRRSKAILGPLKSFMVDG